MKNDTDLLDIFADVSNAYQALLRRSTEVEDLQLSSFQARALAMIARQPGLSQRLLAELAARDKAQVARTVKELEGKNYVERRASAGDWRAHALYLTTDGQAVYEILLQRRAQIAAPMLTSLSEAEKSMLLDLLRRLNTFL